MKNKIRYLFNHKLFVTILTGIIAFDFSAIHSYTTRGTIWDAYPVFILVWFLLIFIIHSITNPKEWQEYRNMEA